MRLSIACPVRSILTRQHLDHTQLPIVSAMQALLVPTEEHVHSVQQEHIKVVVEVLHVPTVMRGKHPSVHSQTV